MPQALAGEKPETKSITFEWNPSPSGNAAGYIVRVSTASAQTNYTFNTGQETRLVVDLPRGESYIATVLAYNIAGESLPADYIRFDLF
ncbi:MAG: fibronectin type III domain-containing protein [Nitrospira sp.]|nr:fibronectin type III domain-containing protein [Nitrospira sp.]